MARIFFLAITFYLVYRLVFDLILPIYKTTKHVRRQFSNMRGPMDEQAKNAHEQQSTHKNGTSSPKKPKVGEYIDFEELK